MSRRPPPLHLLFQRGERWWPLGVGSEGRKVLQLLPQSAGSSLEILCKSCMPRILCRMVMGSWINSHWGCSWPVLFKALGRYVVWPFLEGLWQSEVWSPKNLSTSAPSLQTQLVWFLSSYLPARFSFPSYYTWWSSNFFFSALRTH